MLKSIALCSGLFVLLAFAPVVAQTAAPAPDQSAAPAARSVVPSDAASGSAAKPTAKDLIAGCRADARGKGLKGDALKSAVRDCVGAQRPKLAERMQCRQQAKAQGLTDDALKAAVKTCMAAAKP
jgi:hypothetical protein